LSFVLHGEIFLPEFRFMLVGGTVNASMTEGAYLEHPLPIVIWK